MSELLLQPTGSSKIRSDRRRLDHRPDRVVGRCAGRDALAVVAGSHFHEGPRSDARLRCDAEATMQAFRQWFRDGDGKERWLSGWGPKRASERSERRSSRPRLRAGKGARSKVRAAGTKGRSDAMIIKVRDTPPTTHATCWANWPAKP